MYIKETIKSLDDIEQGAKNILQKIGLNGVVAFYGEMGVGKTTLIKALCSVLGVKDVVSSPTFSLVNEYLGKDNKQIYHFDFYRINTIEEAYDFGYNEYFFSGSLCLVEWPEKIEELLPENTIKVYMEKDTNGIRTVKI